MALERSDVEKIAHLACLGLNEADLPHITSALNSILGLVDEMQAVADALSLMANIVMAWNTSQMQAVLDRWSNRRQVIPPELIGKIAPTRLESINLRGVFRFPVDRYADQILPSRPNASITGTNG